MQSHQSLYQLEGLSQSISTRGPSRDNHKIAKAIVKKKRQHKNYVIKHFNLFMPCPKKSLVHYTGKKI